MSSLSFANSTQLFWNIYRDLKDIFFLNINGKEV